MAKETPLDLEVKYNIQMASTHAGQLFTEW